MIGFPSKCERRGHEWFPGLPAREFIPVFDICLRAGCEARRVRKPTGQCLGQHPIAEHYDDEGNMQPAGGCPGPS